MEFCCYKKIVKLIIISLLLQVVTPAINYAAKTLWPSAMVLENDAINLDKMFPNNATASNSKKGFFLTGDLKEIYTLGVGNVAINVTLSGLGHTFMPIIRGLKERGFKITLVLVNDKAPVGTDLKSAPAEFKNPYFYMIDFNAGNGEWQLYNFNRIVDDYGEYIDNWVIGNEINSQAYNFYGAASITDYTKVYCESFKVCYDKIKERNENANIFISFDQGWDIPSYNTRIAGHDKVLSQYRYNAKEQIALINNYLGKNIDWGISLHPYPAPVDSSYFWDDEYAGYVYESDIEDERPYYLTLKNCDLAIHYLNEKQFLNIKNEPRKIIISEFGLTSHNGQREQAAGLYYLWEKMSHIPNVIAIIYNAQTDLQDGYNFGLTSDKNKKRLIWTVFRDMDKDEDDSKWCKDLLDDVLDEYGYVDINTIVFSKASASEIFKNR